MTGFGYCRNGGSSEITSGSGNVNGLSEALGDVKYADKWPNAIGSGSTGKGTTGQNVTSDIMALPKDDKAVVAGHLEKAIRGDPRMCDAC
ncbi:hypothetical protein [Candidatus Anaplasma sp. TIGMIC]|uniref:hypothetical protein n=1 Tax=Candidatus Anaplasma sp. TIGMIC TaxID=3020713 RepID=UPI0023301130|nr:hypothetical protein [Candidatus Anaplasma sp. TIGMIC]MDB1135802.1 hypothetical protein [Candidatus Anaplasma sp. TIGMIC]